MSNTCSFPSGAHVIAYLRDSGGDDQDLSVPQQEAEVRKFCAAHGLVLTRIFKDVARPGSSSVGRTGFLDLVAYFRSGADDAGLVLWRASRFARDFDDSQFYKADIRRRGYQIQFLKDDIPEGLDGRLYEALLDWMNQKFLEDLSVDVKRGLANLVREYGAVPGRPPRGFMRMEIQIGTRHSGKQRIAHKWVPKPGEFERARRAWRMKLAGASYREIHAATQLYGSHHSYTTFFRNPIYKGELHFSDFVIQDYCEPAVSAAEWDQVQSSLKNRSRIHHEDPAHINRMSSSYLLTGLARCSGCGRALNGHTSSNRWQYYVCNSRKSGTGCQHPRTPRRQLEAAVLKEITEEILRPENLQTIYTTYIRKYSSFQEEVEPLRADLASRLGAVRRQIGNALDGLVVLGASKSVTERIKALELEELELISQLTQIEAVLEKPPAPMDYNELGPLVRLALASVDEERVRTIIRGFVSRIVIERVDRQVNVEIEYIPPPFELPPKGGDLVSVVLPRGGTDQNSGYWPEF